MAASAWHSVSFPNHALATKAENIVPEQLTDEQFWQRYLFHKHMIEAEEEKRKAVFKGMPAHRLLSCLVSGASSHSAASQQGVEDDFSWDDEAESDAASEARSPPVVAKTIDDQLTSGPAAAQAAAADATTPKAGSREKMPVQATVAVPAPAAAPTPVTKVNNNSTSTSPRDSEESYDLVSDQKKSAAQTEDDDSDWE